MAGSFLPSACVLRAHLCGGMPRHAGQRHSSAWGGRGAFGSGLLTTTEKDERRVSRDAASWRSSRVMGDLAIGEVYRAATGWRPITALLARLPKSLSFWRRPLLKTQPRANVRWILPLPNAKRPAVRPGAFLWL